MTRIAEKLMAALICTLLPTGAWAEARIAECEGWPLNVRNIVEPFDQSTRTFANGNIRILHIDTGGEPVCCSSHLVILAPNPAEEEQFVALVRLVLGTKQQACVVVVVDGGLVPRGSTEQNVFCRHVFLREPRLWNTGRRANQGV